MYANFVIDNTLSLQTLDNIFVGERDRQSGFICQFITEENTCVPFEGQRLLVMFILSFRLLPVSVDKYCYI